MSFHCIWTMINEFIFISLNRHQFNLKRNLCISKPVSPNAFPNPYICYPNIYP